MTSLRTLAIGACLAAFATPTLAQDHDWSGLYAGINIGAGETALPAAYSFNNVGAHLGYNHDLGNFVLGVNLSHDVVNFEPEALVSRSSATYLMARVGYDLDDWMPYIGIGVSKNSFVDEPTGTSVSDALRGYEIGVTYRINDTMNVGLGHIRMQSDDFDGLSELELNTTRLSVSYSF